MDRQYQTDDDAVECGKEGHHLVDGEQLAAASVVRPQCLRINPPQLASHQAQGKGQGKLLVEEERAAQQGQSGVHHAGDCLDGDDLHCLHFTGKGDLLGLADKHMIQGAEQALSPGR